jgi:hypothetical protein
MHECRRLPSWRAGEIEREVTAFARGPNRGLIVTSNTLAILHRDLIITLAARYRLPAVYPFRFYVVETQTAAMERQSSTCLLRKRRKGRLRPCDGLPCSGVIVRSANRRH